MKRFSLMFAILAVGLFTFAIDAAPGGERGGERGRPPQGGERGGERGRPDAGGDRGGQRGGPQGREGRRPPMPPLVKALDKNQDGVIDAKEIENAVAALKSLDKNKDGKLTHDEIRPERPGRGGPGQGNRGGDARGGDRRGGDQDGQQGRGPGRGRPDGDAGDRPQRPSRPE